MNQRSINGDSGPVLSSRRRDAAADGEDPRISTTLARGVRILQAFRARDREPLSNKQLAERTGLPKATVSRMTYTLAALNFVARDPISGGYTLAAGVLGPAQAYMARLDIRRLSRPHMERLVHYPGITLSLCTRHELRMTTIEAVGADASAQMTGLLVARAPIVRTAIGHAYLAGLPAPERAAVLAELHGHYADEWNQLSAWIETSLRSVDARGFCVVIGGWTPRVNGVAAPVRLSGGLVLSLSAGGPSHLLSQETLEELGPSLVQVCRAIEFDAGGDTSEPANDSPAPGDPPTDHHTRRLTARP